MVEALAQLGGIALLAHERYAGKLPLFGGIDKARFRRQVVPGDTLELSVELDQLGASAGKGHGTAQGRGSNRLPGQHAVRDRVRLEVRAVRRPGWRCGRQNRSCS